MPVRIVLLAEDIAVGTQVLEYALQKDCALESYESVQSPLALTRSVEVIEPSPSKRVRRSLPKHRNRYTRAKYKLYDGDPVFQSEDSRRAIAYNLLKNAEPSSRYQSDWMSFLREHDYTEAQAKSSIAGLKHMGYLLVDDE